MLDIKVIFYENRFENSSTDNKIQNSYKYSSIYYISVHTYLYIKYIYGDEYNHLLTYKSFTANYSRIVSKQ